MTVELDYSEIDPGIRETVRWLRSHGFETTDSGDGISKFDGPNFMGCALEYPHVFMVLRNLETAFHEADRLHSILEKMGAFVQSAMPTYVQASYSPVDRLVILELGYFSDWLLARLLARAGF